MKRWSLRLSPFLALTLFLGAASGEGVGIEKFFLVIIAMLMVGKIFGELAERVGQPAVLGELLAGVVLGASVLGVVPMAPASELFPGGSIGADAMLYEVIRLLAEVGVALLLFEIGLETDIKEMFRVGPSASVVAIVGVVAPFLLGFAYWMIFEPSIGTHPGDITDTMVAIFIGATLTATSVGITARVLTDLKKIQTAESRVVIGAAVVDDVLGLVILAIVSALAAGAALTLFGIAKTFAIAAGFLVAAVIIGNVIAPPIFGFIEKMRVKGVLLVSAISFALLVGAVAGLVGSALIIGAFAAGIVLNSTKQFDLIVEKVEPVADIFAPIFFVFVGTSVDVSLFLPGSEAFNPEVLKVGGFLILIAVVGKIVSGYSVGWGKEKLNHMAIGVGMIPRGEVGLIFAQIGLARGILSSEVFSAILIMVMATTFIAPPLLKVIFRRAEKAAALAPAAAETDNTVTAGR
jgi:Kef-type K+ transport system membrane component KefB